MIGCGRCRPRYPPGAMEAAGAEASEDKPLAWIRLETDRQTFRHELTVRYRPGGEAAVQLAEVHPHGAWVKAGSASATLKH